MSVDVTREDRAPVGCRDPKLWATAEDLLAVHNAEVAACVACQDGARCTLLWSCFEAMDRAMEPFATRWLRGDDYLVSRVYGPSAGPAQDRQPGTSEGRLRWWPGWQRLRAGLRLRLGLRRGGRSR
jgi:hypothetical protein